MNDPTSLPEPNIPLLRKCVEWAEAEAAKPAHEQLWDQLDYVTEKPCGTAYCIAGYAVAVSPETKVPTSAWGWPTIAGREMPWGDAGQQLLRLTDDEAGDLFADLNTIADVRRVAEQIAARAGERL